MCGIFGWVRTGSNKGLNLNTVTQDGMLQTMTRGRDATGLYTPNFGVMKAAVPATAFELPDVSKERFFIGHCRAASVGAAKDVNNAHPFECDDYILVHNGTCHGLKPLPDYEYEGSTDSEIISTYIHKYGIKLGIEKADVVGVLVVYQKSTNKIYFWSNGARTFHLCRHKGMLFFASERSHIRTALKMQKVMGIFDDANWYKVDDRELVCMNMKNGKNMITELGPTKEHRSTQKVYKYGGGAYDYSSGYGGHAGTADESGLAEDPVRGDASSCEVPKTEWPRPGKGATGRKIIGQLPRKCGSMNPPARDW